MAARSAVLIKYLKRLESLFGAESMIITRVTLTLLFGIIQGLIAFSAMTLAGILYFNVFDIQSLWNIPQGIVNFDSVLLLAFGVFLIASGILLINEWREIR